MLKRLDGPDAEQFYRVVDDENTIVVVDGVPYLIARLPLLLSPTLNDPGFPTIDGRARGVKNSGFFRNPSAETGALRKGRTHPRGSGRPSVDALPG